jgi:hypothetical protein
MSSELCEIASFLRRKDIYGLCLQEGCRFLNSPSYYVTSASLLLKVLKCSEECTCKLLNTVLNSDASHLVFVSCLESFVYPLGQGFLIYLHQWARQ